jgi:mRNA degradation ribonuclease J1/J2
MASLHAMVAQVQMNPSGQVITLNNGQVWQLTEYQRDPFVKAGEGVVIDPASLGSFLMAAERGGLSVRVKRLR